jgi:hypothetical protein
MSENDAAGRRDGRAQGSVRESARAVSQPAAATAVLSWAAQMAAVAAAQAGTSSSLEAGAQKLASNSLGGAHDVAQAAADAFRHLAEANGGSGPALSLSQAQRAQAAQVQLAKAKAQLAQAQADFARAQSVVRAQSMMQLAAAAVACTGPSIPLLGDACTTGRLEAQRSAGTLGLQRAARASTQATMAPGSVNRSLCGNRKKLLHVPPKIVDPEDSVNGFMAPPPDFLVTGPDGKGCLSRPSPAAVAAFKAARTAVYAAFSASKWLNINMKTGEPVSTGSAPDYFRFFSAGYRGGGNPKIA